jgi:hypothetical protein
MKVSVHKPFEKDIEKITDKKIAVQLQAVIEELENCTDFVQVRHIKK